MQSNAPNSSPAELDLAVNDLGPLAWVLDELRKSLDGAVKALKRFVRDAELARGSDLAAPDANQLRIARQQLHQAVGALEMVGLGAPALVLRSMEAAVQRFVQRPEQCSQEAAAKVEQASFALTEYLEGVLADKPISPVSLFPQYRQVQELVRADRIHPADLWPCDWRWLEPELGTPVEPQNYADGARAVLDQCMLQIMRGKAPQAAATLKDLSLRLSAGQADRLPRIFWKIAAAYFEALIHDLLPADSYVKRAASRVLLQYVSLSKGDVSISERLAQDLLFFCSQAVSNRAADTPVLSAVRSTYGLTGLKPVDYEVVQFGRFDPALLAQARKRIVLAKETWSSLSAGDVNKCKLVVNQFGLLTDSLVKLHPPSEPLAQALTRAIDATARSAQAPSIGLSMEVATSVLYLEAAFDDLDPNDPQLAVRTRHLAERLENVRQGGEPQPLEAWMEELYRRVSDKQTMGSVVGELRISLGELEKSLDRFFRNPQDKTVLTNVPWQLAQMRAVLSVLGLDQASQAVLRMRDSVEQMLKTEVDVQLARSAGTFDQLGNNLGALSFLIDMLNYQPALAKKLFVYNEEKDELRPLMGRTQKVGDAASALSSLASSARSSPVAPAAQADAVDFEEDDLQDIFLEEAREVAGNGQQAILSLANDSRDISQLTILRRVFHTLKGSSRMVGLNEFGEAAWAVEQLFNSWLADQKPANEDLRSFSAEVLTAFSGWIEDIAANRDGTWTASTFRASADAMREDGRWLPLKSPVPAAPALPAADVPDTVSFELPADEAPVTVAPLAESVAEEINGIDFESLAALSGQFDAALAQATPLAAENTEIAELSFDLDDLDFADASSESPLAGADDMLDLSQADFDKQFPQAADQLNAFVELADIPDIAGVAEPTMTAKVQVPEVADAEMAGASEARDDQIKVIGDLRIGIPLYNVYLNEADEWSRRLVTEMAEWAIELHQPVGDSAVALAHSLAGSSATVGFEALSTIAHALEHALQHSQTHYSQSAALEYSKVFVDASDDIRRLLHQFAAGFLKQPDAGVLERIHGLDFSAPVSVSPEDAEVAAVEVFAGSDGMRRQARAAQVDDEFDAVDAIDPELFPIFEEEATELMLQLGAVLRQWSTRPDNASARMEVLRALHTLKGSARLAGAMRVGEMAHRIESEIEYLGSEAAATQDFEPLLSRFDAMEHAMDALRRADATQTAMPSSKALVPAPQATALQPLRPAASGSIRVRSQLLDRMVNQVGEVMITRARLEAELGQLRGSLNDLSGNLNRLRAQLRDVELHSETQMQSRLQQAKEAQLSFDPLEFDRFTRVQELTRMMAESVNDVATVQRTLQRTVEATEDDLIAQAHQTRELQRDLLRTRMVEFEGISERLYRVVRQASKETGKQVRLDLQGGTIEMDRGMLDRMTPAFEHLLRNCVTHGIEDPQTRTHAGKDASGLITVSLQQSGNDVSIEFRDDGAGLNLPRIREKALASGLLAAGQQISDDEAANLIFTPGFSTASQVTELTGRGIGMNVVRSEVNSLGGRIETSTVAGKGTNFKLVLPLTTAVTQVVMLRAGGSLVGVPANVVETVRRISAKDLQQAYNTGVLDVAGEAVPFFWSGALLQVSRLSSEPQGKTAPVVVFRSAAQRLALHVDEVLGNQAVVVKNLGPQLSRLPGLVGMSVLASGAVVLIYNPVALAFVYGQQARAWSFDSGLAGASPTPVAPLILVVDDSITVRRVIQRLLRREGYRVSMAVDGLQALECLQEERPTVVLSDIEMPRMDGFDLARNIRGDVRWRDIPIIMITSRIAEKHNEYAKKLGVDHYLGKPYTEDVLLSLIRHYCSLEAAS